MGNLFEQFFWLSHQAVEQEDSYLRSLFEKCSDKYAKHHHGVAFLYETTYVYLILKKLLESDFPAEVIWEHPYPNNGSLHADLGIIEDQKKVTLVEFKLWTTEDDKQIKGDIEKLRQEPPEVGKLVYVISYGGDKEDNIKYLLEHNDGLKLLDDATVKTRWCFWREPVPHRDNNIDLLLFSV